MASISGEMKIVEVEGLRLEEPVAIIGFPGPGFVGSSAAACLIVNLDMFEIAHLESTRILPIKFIVGTHESTMHPFRIYRNLRGDIVVLRQEGLGVTSPSELHDIAMAFVDWLGRKKVKEVLFLDGNQTRQEEAPETFVFSQDIQKLNELKRLGIRPLPEGSISGITPAMMDECTRREIPWAALIASTRGGSVDFQAVELIIDALNKILGLNVDPRVLMGRERQKERGTDVLRSIRRFFTRET